jgi:hypothetical protein
MYNNYFPLRETQKHGFHTWFWQQQSLEDSRLFQWTIFVWYFGWHAKIKISSPGPTFSKRWYSSKNLSEKPKHIPSRIIFWQTSSVPTKPLVPPQYRLQLNDYTKTADSSSYITLCTSVASYCKQALVWLFNCYISIKHQSGFIIVRLQANNRH